MKNKNVYVFLLLVFASIACTVTTITPTATNTPISTHTPLPATPMIASTPTQEKSESSADNIILAAVIQAIAAVIAAIIGVAGTIIVALISKKYVDNQISHSKESSEIKPLARTIIQALSIFHITGASVFVVKSQKTYIDPETGISIAINDHLTNLDAVNIIYHLPGQAKPQVVQNARIGWRVLLNYQNDLYTLTLVSMYGSVYVYEARFDFRKVNYVIEEISKT